MGDLGGWSTCEGDEVREGKEAVMKLGRRARLLPPPMSLPEPPSSTSGSFLSDQMKSKVA